VRAKLDRLLAQGVATALNVGGFSTVEAAVAASRFHPITVKVTTLHTPTHLERSTAGPFSFGGLRERHRWTIEETLASGAPAIAEAGPGVDAHWSDYTLIPEAVAAHGGHAGPEQTRELREEPDRLSAVREVLVPGQRVPRPPGLW